MSDDPVHRGQSHDEGRNAAITVYADRIERVTGRDACVLSVDAYGESA